jgi:hypothetical protein
VFVRRDWLFNCLVKWFVKRVEHSNLFDNKIKLKVKDKLHKFKRTSNNNIKRSSTLTYLDFKCDCIQLRPNSLRIDKITVTG